MKCSRSGCTNDLNTGSVYCSTKCAAQERERKRSEMVRLTDIPVSITNALEGMGNVGGVIDEVRRFLQEETISVPLPHADARTYGDWTLSFDDRQDLRPYTALDFDIIEKMLRSGPVQFAMMMKMAQVYRVFSEGRYKIISPDEELQEITTAALRPIMPKMAYDFCYSAFAYGTSFQEKLWEYTSKYHLGIEGGDKKKTILVPKVPASVNPRTVEHIRREPGTLKFDGFAQHPRTGFKPIVVDVNSALVIPLNERFRNMWGESFLYGIYPIWVWYEILMRAMMRYMDRMASPVVVAKAPSRAMVTVTGQSAPVKAMDLALIMASGLAKSNAVAIPSDRDPETNQPLWEIGYLSADEKSQPFINVLEFLVQEMIRSSLSADRSLSQSSGGTGSFNIGEVHARASALTSEMILLQFLYYLNKYFIKDFSLYNRGQDGPPIYMRTQALDMQERDMMMALMNIAGNNPASQEFFNMLDWRTMAETSNVPVLSEEEVEALKKKLQEESLSNQEDQQKILQKYAKNAEGNTQKGGIPPKDKKTGQTKTVKPGATKAEDDNYANIVYQLTQDGIHIPWILNDYEVGLLIENRTLSEESIKLFNPFHSRADGKFTSGPGGSASGSSPFAETTLSPSANPATAKKGGFLRTTGKVLGLTGLGVVGFMVLAGVANAGNDPLEDRQIANQKQAEKLQAQLSELTKNWPKASSPEMAAVQTIDALKQIGVTEFPDGLQLQVVPQASGIGGRYDANTNILQISPDLAGSLAEGDPVAIWALAHELAHAQQEFDPTGRPQNDAEAVWGPNDQMTGDYTEDFSSFFEGQNDLVTAMAISDIYGKPMSNDVAVGLSNEYIQTKSSLLMAQSGSGVFGSPEETLELGYQRQAEVWAGIAAVGADKTGLTPREFLIGAHKTGFAAQSQHEILRQVFPEEMNNGFYSEANGRIERRFPSQADIRQWAANHGYVDLDKAYDQMLEEAAR